MPEEDTPPEGGKTFTQADLDRHIEDRLQRERKNYSDYDELKAKAVKFDEASKAGQTELERLQGEIKERDTQIAALPAQSRQQAIRFASQATRAGFLDPEDALAFIDADLADDDAVKKALADLAERKPHLVRAEVKKKLPARPKPDNGTPDDAAAGGVKGKERAAAALRQLRT